MYILIEDRYITRDELDKIKFDNVSPAPIMNEEVGTGYSIIKLDKDYPSAFPNSKRLSATEALVYKNDILSTGTIDPALIYHKVDLIDDYGKPVIKQSAFLDAEGRRARLTGICEMEVPAGQEMSKDYPLTEDRYVDGAVYKGFNTNWNDCVKFEIVDVNYQAAGLLYPSEPFLAGVPVPEGTPWSAVAPNGVVLDNFAENWYVSDTLEITNLYPAKLYAGLSIRVTYCNQGTNDIKFWLKLKLHREGRG